MSGEAGMGREKRGKQTLRKKMTDFRIKLVMIVIWESYDFGGVDSSVC